MKLHPHAAGLFAIRDPDWRGKICHGGLLLLVPIFGWPAILGYRKELVEHLLRGGGEALPRWKGRHLHYYAEGLKAMGVIFGTFLPLYLALALVVLNRGWRPDTTTLWIAIFFTAFPIFSTLSFPVACLLLTLGIDPGWISPAECAAFLVAFGLTTFLIPAGFLRVSSTGRYRSAFALWNSIPFIARHFRAYVAAWFYSSGMSLLGHLAIPFSPWGVTWCYLGIIFLFNEILHHAEPAASGSWMARVLADERLAGKRSLGVRRTTDAAGAGVLVLDLRLFSVPLPMGRGQ